MDIMQVQQTTQSLFTTRGNSAGAESNRPQGAGFAGALDRAMAVASDPSDSKTIHLGTLTRERPTVSHLLAGHPEYGSRCWEIIHSDINRDKPWTRIPAGTEIYLDPETKEISWEKGAATSRNGAPPLSGAWNPAGIETPPPVRDQGSPRERIEASIDHAAARYNLPRELIASVIRAESNFDTDAVSRAGAQGLMQLMPGTARELGVENPFDISENIDAGSRYLKKMIELFGGSLEKALAAYNAGPGAVRRFNGNVPYQETRQYVSRVLSFME